MQAGNSNEIVLCFWSTSITFGFVLSCFMMFPNSIIMLSTKEKYTFNSIFQKISDYTKVKITEEDLYLVLY